MNKVLILQEVNLHPNSIITKLCTRFEQPSIIRVFSKDTLKSYKNKPIYNDSYLVLFDSEKLFDNNLGYIDLEFMFPVVICPNKNQVYGVKDLCVRKCIPYELYVNKFEKDDAFQLVRSLSSEELSDNFCKTLVNRVGLNPQRIINATRICEQVGYKTSNIIKYVDKYIYIDVYDVIDVLLGICKSKAQSDRAVLYLHQNRLWYSKYIKSILLKEIDILLTVYKDLIKGNLTVYNVQEYSENNGIPRYKLLYCIDIFEKISLIELEVLRNYIAVSSLLEVSLKILY